jgi:hypothetical protein
MGQLETETESSRANPAKPLAFWETLFFSVVSVGIVALAIFAFAPGKGAALAAALALQAFAAGTSGALVGFLFGVPRPRSDDNGTQRARRNYLPSTNLAQVSEWLTKLVLGATLVELKPLVAGFGELTKSTATYLGNVDIAPIVGAIYLGFGFVGFLWGYLWVSLRIRDVLERADRDDE